MRLTGRQTSSSLKVILTILLVLAVIDGSLCHHSVTLWQSASIVQTNAFLIEQVFV